RRRQRRTRSGSQEVRLSGLDSDAGESAIAECLGRRGRSPVRSCTAEAWESTMKFLCALCALCGWVFPAAALDREAFTFTKYDLDVRIEPEQQRLGVRGKITLRNDSDSPQKNLALQISSTLNWSSIQFEGKPAEFASHIY